MWPWFVGGFGLALALVVWLTGVDGLTVLATFGWPFVPAGLVAAFTRIRLSRVMLSGAIIGIVPAGLLAFSQLFGHRSSSADMTPFGAFVLVLMVLAIPDALFGAFGGFCGMFMRPPASPRATSTAGLQ